MKSKTKPTKVAVGRAGQVRRLCFKVDCVVSSEQSSGMSTLVPTKWEIKPGKPAVFLSADDPIIVPGLISDVLSLSVAINGRPFFLATMDSAPAPYKDNLEKWPEAVAGYIEKWFPMRLEGLMDELLRAANASGMVGTPKAMAQPNQADTRERLEKRAKKLRAKQIPSPNGRPRQGKEKLGTRQRILSEQEKLIADVKKYKEEYRRTHRSDHGIKTYVARMLYYDKINNPLQKLRRQLKPTGSSFESV
jgi:hypothetical protein